MALVITQGGADPASARDGSGLPGPVVAIMAGLCHHGNSERFVGRQGRRPRPCGQVVQFSTRWS